MPVIATAVFSRNPLFKSFLFANTISLLGSNVFDLAMPLYILGKTHSIFALAVVNLAINLPYFVMAPLTGYIVDHFDKRRVMLAADLVQITCMVGLMVIESVSPASLWPIAAMVFMTKTMMICFDTVVTFQLIPALINEKESLSDANTWFLSSHRLIQIVGPLLGGVLLSLFGIKGCIALNFFSFTATLYFVYRLRHLTEIIDGTRVWMKAPFPTPSRVIESFRSSMKYIWGSRIFRPFIFLMFFWNLSSLCPNTPTMIYYFTEHQRFSVAEYGVISSCFGLLGILGFLTSGFFYKTQQFRQTFVAFSMLHTLLSVAAAALFQIPALFTLCFATSRFGSSIVSMGTFLLRQTRVPKNSAGGVNACLRMLFMSAVPLSILLQSAIIHRWGIGASIFTGALCLIMMLHFSKQVAKAQDAPRQKKPMEKAA